MASKYRWAAVAALTVLLSGVAQALSLPDLAGHWAAPFLGALAARGIMVGDTEGHFQPESPLTRAQMARMITVGLGLQADSQVLARYASRFTDVPRGHWGSGYIEILTESDIAQGYGDGTFGPEDQITRAQMAVMLTRAAGLSDQATTRRLQPTDYKDDQDLPHWARGAVNVAQSAGLMAGFDDGTFKPLQQITRAEGGVSLLRLLATKGRAYNLTGTLVKFDPITLRGSVRDELGQERSFILEKDGLFFRGGQLVMPDQIRVLDQVWILMDETGKARYLDARYKDLLAGDAKLSGTTLAVTLQDGSARSLPLQTGALVFVNGQPEKMAQLEGAQQVYLSLDVRSGDVRVVDAVKTSVSGTIALTDASSITLLTGARYLFTGNAMLIRSGRRIALSELSRGEEVHLATDANGAITFLQVR